MIKEHYYNTTGAFIKAHDFAEKRKSDRLGNYLHAGIDWDSKQKKSQDIYDLLAGVVEDFGNGKDYGKFVLIRHNPSLIGGGANDKLYSLYCHLSEIRLCVARKRFLDSGVLLGKMGNTGNCWTRMITGQYRRVTDKEVRDPHSKRGVHLHQQFHQIAQNGFETPLLKDMLSRGILTKGDNNSYFYQWGKLMINPDAIMKYFMLLQGRE